MSLWLNFSQLYPQVAITHKIQMGRVYKERDLRAGVNADDIFKRLLEKI